MPLNRIAERYGNDKEGFLKNGLEHGGESVTMADAAVRLAPLPRVPVTVTLVSVDSALLLSVRSVPALMAVAPL